MRALLFFLALIGASCGLVVDEIHLTNPYGYITYLNGPSPEDTTLVCNYTLDQDEEVAEVFWVMWQGDQEVGTFLWKPEGGAEATGRLEGLVNLAQEQGWLELTELRYDLAGFYSCVVTLTDNSAAEADQWELLIVDTCASSSYTYINDKDCVFKTSHEWTTIFPDPTVHSGLYSESLGRYYDEVTDLNRTVHSNNSVTYDYGLNSFVTDANTPHDVVFLTTTGVTKQDGTYFLITAEELFSNAWSKLGCPALVVGDLQRVVYSEMTETCRGEYHPYSDYSVATIYCKLEHPPQSDITSLEFKCDENDLTWSPSLDTLDDLKCSQ